MICTMSGVFERDLGEILPHAIMFSGLYICVVEMVAPAITATGATTNVIEKKSTADLCHEEKHVFSDCESTGIEMKKLSLLAKYL